MQKPFDFARVNALRALAVLMAVTLIGGCGIFSPDEDSDTGPTGGSEFPPATTTEIFKDNFQRAWEERNVDEYDKLLADDFVFYLSQADINDEFPAGFWDRATEIETAEFMFGEKVPDNQAFIVESIEFSLFNVKEAWSSTITNENFQDAEQVATFSVRLQVRFASGLETVQGQQRMYVKRVAREIDNQTVNVYVLRAWEDLGVDL